ncbi:hypothetical protein LPMP_271770 [Leishmania panamensis]|uniref:Uncharacterized protein n=1 Tax=Leishmania panamensis TaxID=5679 RepID=A0A088RUH4_LEIPA|nr:hypothetical protein LPMP_271770 [Leishmania panamensis]AIN99555.1 hypothetical protein LPMP_271770 [Leishmania panamensis]
MCETRCESGPGSTWSEAPALFFSQVTDGPPVSLLTLCGTCATAVGGDMQATSQQVLQRCHHTPVIRYRTVAYVNVVREYKLLLELMAGKVVRSCERMQSMQASVARQQQQQQRQHAYGSAEEQQSYMDPSISVSRVSLTSLCPSLQEKVLSQLLEALEDLLQRDRRAVRLAAGQTPLSQERSLLPLSEAMAPRERHVLLEELAHVERQLMNVRSSATAAMVTPARPGLSPQPLRDRHLYDVPSANRTHPRGRANADDGGVVYSPRSPVQPHQLPQRSSASPYGRVVEEAAGRLASVADPRRYFQHCHALMPGTSKVAQMRSYPDTSGRAPRPSQSRESSPPELTSPQRGTYGGSASNTAGHDDGDNVVSGNHIRASGGIAVVGAPPSAAITTTAPFPFSPAPRQVQDTSGNYHSAVGSASRADCTRDVQHTRLPSQDGTHRRGAVSAVQSQPLLDQEARRSLQALIGTAMWEAYRRPPPAEGESREPATHSSEEVGAGYNPGRCRRHGAVGRDIGNPNSDSDLQLWDYFAGRLSTTPALPVGCGGGGNYRTPPSMSPSPAFHLLTCEDRGSVVPLRQQTDATSQAQDETVAAGVFDSPHSDLSSHDIAALQRRVLHERQLRQEAKEAMLSAHTRIAALEMTTNDMAEMLLTHRLSVTFRAHLEGMEMLVGRWTRLAQNFCLQKSLLFAEEASVMVRQLLRKKFGVKSLWSPRTPQQQSNRRPTSPCVEARPSRDERQEDELWVSREEDKASDTVRDSSFWRRSDGGHHSAAAAVMGDHSLKLTGEEEEVHHRHSFHANHPSACSLPERQPLHQSPPSSTPASTSFSFPTTLQLQPLSLRL